MVEEWKALLWTARSSLIAIIILRALNKNELASIYHTMNALFAQSITQFTTLRAYTRLPVIGERDQIAIVRDLFPKAVIDEQEITGEYVFEIAWSFLSQKPTGEWVMNGTAHRIGGLPAIIYAPTNALWWRQNGGWHRNCKDLRTGLTFPAMIHANGAREWLQREGWHRIDKDPRTGLTLPAVIGVFGYCWYYDGKLHRDDRDPRTGVILPAVIYANGAREYWINGVRMRK